jgi:hypothetical protein
MSVNTIVVFSASALLAFCANSIPLCDIHFEPSSGYQNEPDPGKQTVASKVLGAMALERVTGRRPDPSRLYELH